MKRKRGSVWCHGYATIRECHHNYAASASMKACLKKKAYPRQSPETQEEDEKELKAVITEEGSKRLNDF